MRVTHLEIQDMWSVGTEPLVLSDLEHHSILIGKNNSGKSKVLTALRWLAAREQQYQSLTPFALDPSVVRDTGEPTPRTVPKLLVRLDFHQAEVDASIQAVLRNQPGWSQPTLQKHMGRTVEIGVEPDPTGRPGYVVPFFRFTGVQAFDPAENTPARFNSVEQQRAAYQQILQNWESGPLPTARLNWVKMILQQLRYVGGWRSLRNSSDPHNSQIIKHLHQWREPSQAEKHRRFDFARIEHLFQNLILDPHVRLRPVHDGNDLNLGFGDQYIPIEACGDGLQHLLMIAYHVTTAADSLMLLEEPETHLHPGLQRNLMRVLRRELRGQSIITTHSPVLLDAGLASSVYRIEHRDKCTSGHRCETDGHLYQVLDELDVRASDVLQANIVIWVEGPTDRMFLKKCLELRNEPFEEGIHYQIAYYGGRLRSHLTFEGELPDLVNLMKLCRKNVMVCDSDLEAEAGQLDQSKQRLKEECERAGGLYWITAGREIENYIPDSVLTRAYATLLDNPHFAVDLPRYSKLVVALQAKVPHPAHGQGWKINYEDNKARVMPRILEHMTAEDLNQYDLQSRLNELVGAIRAANPSD